MDLPQVPAPDVEARRSAVARHEALAVPAGALGKLAELGACGSSPRRVTAHHGRPRSRGSFVVVADHGVAAAGVSAEPAGRHARPDGRHP